MAYQLERKIGRANPNHDRQHTCHKSKKSKAANKAISSLSLNKVNRMADRIHQTQYYDNKQDKTWKKFWSDQPQYLTKNKQH